ncbi:transcriptional regulator with XRE-family HTH domain [Paenibacillus sp. PastF-1]|nr:transcriptional regulator with XRE-family HTH domain [Paenibacillus sp. PastF-2]MDF9851233.1 transcriptional regulator with XRE-family HTH domain [Paenibacillus sp. PastM-2]MDF9857774.1 transcriptional regulator with XRE-family HTH domain [Paenibacillus sp. PastF-1]MDH6483082.1 transcriptional regulator with XRE-family HTH domain [Paenibacillus sp. PastH-2]MDH6510454.1 transcriptional regulator with XRE-family HTH domain [Paenibacillus sp. PastM-3]
MEIANKIIELMKEKGLSRYKLAKLTGVPYTTLIKILDGTTRNPQIQSLDAIAAYFGVTVDYLQGKSIVSLIERRLTELNMSVEDLEKEMEFPQGMIESLDNLPPAPWDYEKGEIIDRLSKILKIDSRTLASAYARQEPPVYDGPSISVEKAFGDNHSKEPETIAAHHDGEEWTEEELEEIERFKQFVKMKRGPRAGE